MNTENYQAYFDVGVHIPNLAWLCYGVGLQTGIQVLSNAAPRLPSDLGVVNSINAIL